MRLLKSSFVFFFLLITATVSAQNLSNMDFQNMNVDNLSDQQLRQMYQQLQSRGISINQAVQMAVARGMPQNQASRLAQRLQRVSTSVAGGARSGLAGQGRLRTQPIDTSNFGMPGLFPGDTTGFMPGMFASPAMLKYQVRQDSIQLAKRKLRDRIFGYSLFSVSDQSFQPALNIPTPINYQLGPGDEVIIDIWGAAEMTYQLVVSPDGMINIQNLGPIHVSGLTIKEVNERLYERLGEIYSGLNPPNESNKDTYMQVTLGQVRSIDVTVLGEVRMPGTYTISSLSTVFNALIAAGGPSTTGSFRKINVLRGDSVATSFDLYDLLVASDQSDNIRLRSQDIVQVQPYINRVEITGEIKRPGIYELKKKETLADLIQYAGDFTDKAYTDRIKVIGNTPKQKRITDVNKGRFDNFILSNGDSVHVGKILDRFVNKVEIRGAVYRPGEYALNDTTTLYSLIQRADGLMGDAFMNRGIIYRTRDNYTIESISFNVRELMDNPVEHNIKLLKNDIVKISSIFELRENFTIGINGPILQPGQYEFVYDMTLEDLIYQAGGFRQEADPHRIEVARRIRDISDSTRVPPSNGTSSKIANIYTFKVSENLTLSKRGSKFKLQPFDEVYIRELPNYEQQKEIHVVGEVKYPGKYSLSSRDDRISDLIKRAGGITSEAYTQGATLFRQQEFIQQRAQQTQANIEGQNDEEENEQNLQNQRLAQVGINLPRVLNNPGSKYDLYLEEGDSLFVPKQLQTVTVKGGVFYPTTIRFEGDRSFQDYITAAGGYTELAKKKSAYIIYPNGDVDRAKSFLFFKNFPDVAPGATIVVPEKDQLTRLSPQERISIYSSITSTAVLIVTTIIQITN